jgi:hypothetical protein
MNATSRSNALKASGHQTASALTSGYHLAFWVAAALVGCALAVVLVAVELGRAPAHAHAHGDADARGPLHRQHEAQEHGSRSAEGASA